MKKLRKPVICVIVLVMAVLLSGCMKMHIDIIWNEDNSASLSMTIGVATYALSMMDLTEEDMQQQLRESLEEDTEVSDDYTIENYSDSEYTGIVATIKIDDITKSDEDSIEHLKFTFEESGGTKIYTVIGDFMDSDIMGNEAEEFEIDTRITIVMPGRLVSHNATESSGNRLTWIQEDSNVAVSIYARSEVGGGMPWLWIVIGAVVLVAGGVVAILLVLKKKKPAPQAGPYGDAATTAYGAPAQGYTPGQQPYAQQYQQPPPYEPPQPAAPPPAPTYEPPPQPAPPIYETPPPPPPPPAPPAYEPPAPDTVPVQQPAAPPPPQPAAPEPAPVSTPKFCMQCGAPLPAGTKFCPSCGAPTA